MQRKMKTKENSVVCYRNHFRSSTWIPADTNRYTFMKYYEKIPNIFSRGAIAQDIMKSINFISIGAATAAMEMPSYSSGAQCG